MKLRTLLLVAGLLLISTVNNGQDKVAVKNKNAPASFFNTGLSLNKDSVFYFLNLAGRIGERNPDSALSLIIPLLKYSREKQFTAGIGYALTHMANIRKHQGQYDLSRRLYFRAKAYCAFASRRDTGYVKLILANWYNNLGGLYVSEGKFDSALLCYYKGSIDLSSKGLTRGRDSVLYTTLLGNLAAVYIRFDENRKAIHYFNIAEKMARLRRDTNALRQILSNKASAYNQEGIYDSAAATYQQALAIMKDSSEMLSTYSNLGILMLKQGHGREAVRMLRKKIEDFKRLETNRSYLFMHYVLGAAYAKQGQYEKAIAVLKPAVDASLAVDYKGFLSYPYETLSQSFAATGDYEQAYHYHVLFSRAYQESGDKKQLQSVNKLEAKYQALVKDKELTEKTLQLSQKENKIKKKNLWIVSICSAFLLVLAILIGWRINYRRKQKIKLLEAVMKGEENERGRIAKDLHDGVSQTVGSAKLNLMALEHDLPLLPRRQKMQLKKSIELVDNSFVEIRQLSHHMMPRVLGEANLEEAITQLVASFEALPLRISLYTEGMAQRFESLVEVFVYRLIQECLNNAIRHAHATRIDISVVKEESNISITIEDDGVGFDPDDKSITGIGLKNITARVRLLKGEVEFDAAPGKGTLVALVIPTMQDKNQAIRNG